MFFQSSVKNAYSHLKGPLESWLKIIMTDDLKPKYKWRITWPDPNDRDSWLTDFQSWDGDVPVGRIRFEAQGPLKDMWQWSGHGPHKRVKERLLPQQGYEKSARLAVAKAEDYYDLLVHNKIIIR